jgi:alpha-L-rhamnosidase
MKHLTTGFVGTPFLCRALSDNGYADLAFMLLMRKEYPSWLYPVTKGATTIWERWDGIKTDGTFQDYTMNSFNHYSYGAIGEWIYSYVGGIEIDPENPGYRHFFLHPHPGGGLSYACTKLTTMYGKIVSDWELAVGEMKYRCTVPPNTSATVFFDNADSKIVLLNNKPLNANVSFRFVDENGKLRIELGSGDYVFTVPVHRNKTE